MATYKLIFATTQHNRKCITVPGMPPALAREEVLRMAQGFIDADKTPARKGKLRRFLRAECYAKSTVKIL